MTSRSREIFVHVASCIAFLVLPILFAPGPRLSFHILERAHTQRELLGYVLMVLFFYANYLIFIPKLYFNGRYWIFVGALILCFTIITVTPSLFIPHEMFQDFRRPKFESRSFLFEVGHHFLGFLVVLFVSMTLSINNKWKQVQEEKLVAELSYLKAQINPHFLFNTLNSIYALAIEKSDKTAMAVIKLSGMMRYVISEAHHDFVSLEQEINYLDDYIALQKIRLEDTVEVLYEVEGNVVGKQIAPLILIPFVENAFKYGVNPEEESAIAIQIALTETTIEMMVKNKKVNTRVSASERSGLGIPNARTRLQLLYAGRHELNITDDESMFAVSLKIDLQ